MPATPGACPTLNQLASFSRLQRVAAPPLIIGRARCRQSQPPPFHAPIPLDADLLGAGRSARVFRHQAPDGSILATKVFVGEGLANLVNTAILGAPVPYGWHPDAIKSAHWARTVLDKILNIETGGRVRIAQSRGVSFNPDLNAHQLHTQFIEGRPVAMPSPFSPGLSAEYLRFREEVQKPLLGIMRRCGFTGARWQVGEGNPVALNNFLLSRNGTAHWIGIDIESGVPAIFSPNPVKQASFYLREWLRRGRPLFDDVDGQTLRRYLRENRDRFAGELGRPGALRLEQEAEELIRTQARWRTLRPHELGIAYALTQGEISSSQSDWYSRHPLLWRMRAAGKALVKGYSQLVEEAIPELLRRIYFFPLTDNIHGAWRFVTNPETRNRKASQYVGETVSRWSKRAGLSEPEARELAVGASSAAPVSRYAIDQLVNVALNAAITKPIQYAALPALVAGGTLSAGQATLAYFIVGGIVRSIYTGSRCIYSAATGNELPVIALFVGMFPKVGQGAYLFQMAFSRAVPAPVAKTLLMNFFGGVGRKLPIWGGPDTATEHHFANIGAAAVMRARRLFGLK